MANKEVLRTVAGRALTDLEFRRKLIDDPEAAVKEAGFDLSYEQMKALKEMDKERFETLMTDLDGRLTMGCWARIPGTGCGWR